MYFLNIQAKKDNKLNPHFRVQKKEENQIITLKDETEVSGYLYKIAHGSYEYESKTQRTISMHLVDGDDEFKIELNINTNTGRNIMNRVIATQEFGWVVIRVYLKDEKYVSVFMENDQNRMEWAYKPDDVKHLVKEVPDPADPSKKIKIYHELNSMLLDKWIAHEPIVAENARKKGFIKEADQKKETEEKSNPEPGSKLQEEFDKTAAPHPNDYKPPIEQKPPVDDNDDLPF